MRLWKICSCGLQECASWTGRSIKPCQGEAAEEHRNQDWNASCKNVVDRNFVPWQQLGLQVLYFLRLLAGIYQSKHEWTMDVKKFANTVADDQAVVSNTELGPLYFLIPSYNRAIRDEEMRSGAIFFALAVDDSFIRHTPRPRHAYNSRQSGSLSFRLNSLTKSIRWKYYSQTYSLENSGSNGWALG